MYLISTRTSSGILYEVDARVYAPLARRDVGDFSDAFADYQQHEARLGEHQGVGTRRAVYGDPQLTSQFDAVRRTIIMTTARDGKTLQTEVRECARWAHLGNKHAIVLILKPMKAVITDIESFYRAIFRYRATPHEKPKFHALVWITLSPELLAQNGIMDEPRGGATVAYTNNCDELHHRAAVSFPGHGRRRVSAKSALGAGKLA